VRNVIEKSMFRLNHPNAKGRALPPKPSSVMTTSPVLALVLVKRQDQATHGGTSAGGGDDCERRTDKYDVLARRVTGGATSKAAPPDRITA